MNFSKKNHELLKINRLITIVILLVFTTSVSAQWFGKVKGNGDMVTKTRNVGEYDKVSVGGSFDVKLYAGAEGKLTITVDENLLEYLITEVDNGKLKIKWKKGTNVSSRSNILVTVPFKDIDAVSLAGSGDVYTEDVIKADSFKTALAGSGDIKLKVDASSVDSSIAGSGDIALSGSANSIKCSIAGSGDIEAYDLSSNDADIRISGSGGVTISVKDNLVARISGSGNIYYKGDPEKQDVKVSGSGNVSSK
jgi:hypothetical protein